MTNEPITFQGTEWQWDDTSLPECGLCHCNRLCPYIVEDGLFIDGKPLIVQICQQCRDTLLAICQEDEK